MSISYIRCTLLTAFLISSFSGEFSFPLQVFASEWHLRDFQRATWQLLTFAQPVKQKICILEDTHRSLVIAPEGNQAEDITFQVSSVPFFPVWHYQGVHPLDCVHPNCKFYQQHSHCRVFTRVCGQAIPDPVCISWATRVIFFILKNYVFVHIVV